MRAEANLPRSTTFRLLADLESAGYVRRDSPGTFALSLKLLQLAGSVLEHLEVRDIANPVLAQMAESSQRTAHVAVRDGLEAVCVARAESPNALKLTVPIGRRTPLYAGAAAKVLLAFAPDEVAEEVLSRPMPRLASRTPTTSTELRPQLNQIRLTEHVVTFSEVYEGAYSIAAPIRASTGAVIAALALGGIEVGSKHAHDELLRQVLHGARTISSRLALPQLAKSEKSGSLTKPAPRAARRSTPRKSSG